MDAPIPSDILKSAVDAARDAAAMAVPRLGQARAGRKADNSVVTETDHAIQEQIVNRIAQRFPDHAVIAEELLSPRAGRPAPHEADYCWVIDPLDGTRNFVAGLPCFSTSIAVLKRGRPIVAAVFEHNAGNLFTATIGHGACLNDEPVTVCPPNPGHDLLIGIPSSKDPRSVRVIERAAATRGLVVRNLGSTALQLALVASGALAGVFCMKCKIWDIAAGVLLVNEAGGRVTDWDGAQPDGFDLTRRPGENIPILAASPHVLDRLLPLAESGV